MNIHFQQVMPTPLASIQHGADSIWGADIELKKGEHVLLNASSGKGKSTFTFTSIGLRKDYEGKIFYDGRDIKEFKPTDWTSLRQNHLSVVFQDLQLFPGLTVAENLQLKNSLTNVYTDQELQDKLSHVGIGEKWSQQCGLLSMGQQQRVAIVRALTQPFDWLIMDEPFSHLDKENADKCLQLIVDRCNELGAGFVLTSLGEDHGYNYSRELKL
jgi:ABC-type lipoprotein export system ATPase subunit